MLSIKIKYHDPYMPRIKKFQVGDWIDLRAAKDYDIPMFKSALIDLGISIELPEGYEAIIAPRSSTYKKYGVIQTNSIGVIDHAYCGDDDVWMMPVLAMRDTKIWKGDRICQFRIVKNQPEVEMVEVNTLQNESRGGFGSTGNK